MILNNFVEVFMTQGVIDTNIRGEKGRGVNTSGNGSTNYGRVYLNTYVDKVSSLNTGNFGQFTIALGTNATPVTPDDYAWGNSIDTLTTLGWSLTTALKDGRKVLRFTRSVTNDTDEDIVVSEIGILINVSYGNVFLIAREVLNTPITVKANGGAQVFGIDIG